MVKKKVCLGCNCITECLDQEAEAVLWINDYYKKKAGELQLYKENVAQYVMPKFWQTQEEFCYAREYSMKVCKMILAELAGHLDLMHHSCFGERGWNIILGDWLRIYIEGFYDKYIRIKYLTEHYPNLYLSKKELWYIPRGRYLRDNEILQEQQFRDTYNFVYFKSAMVDMENEEYGVMQNISSQIKRSSKRNDVKDMAVKTLRKLLCRKEITVYLGTQYLALSRTVLELLSRGRIERIDLPDGIVFSNSVSVDMRKRIERKVSYEDDFINLVYDCLWRHIPMEFVEDFQDYYKAFHEFELKTPAKIIDSISVYYNILFKIFAAEAINYNCKLEIIQHGGDYCIEKYTGSWEFEIADKFYTWGNGFINNNRVTMHAMPCPKTLSIRWKKQKGKRKILFVEYANYPYVPRFEELHAMKMEEFYRQEEIFFQSLEQNCRDLLEVRCHHIDQWWDRKNVLAKRFPWMQFDANSTYYASMTEAKLVVTNVIGTTCMEAISCNIPTILFFSEDFFVPDENAIEILNELRRVEVLLDSPRKAADLINKHAGHIDRWWNEKERRKVIKKFREMYASRGWFPKLRWVGGLIKESRSG